jgi:hypothetical protein
MGRLACLVLTSSIVGGLKRQQFSIQKVGILIKKENLLSSISPFSISALVLLF